MIDGHGFDADGVTGAFIADAVVSGGICVLLWVVLFHVLRVRGTPTAVVPAAGAGSAQA